jgi:hypothetical protein
VTSGSPDSFLEVQAPADLDDALPTKRHPIVVETVDEEDEEDKEDEEAKEAKERKEADIASLSDLDEALSDGASSYGDKPVFAGSPNLQDLVRLGQEHCRSPCNIKNKEGVKTASVCGKTVVECGRHAETRLGQGKSGQGKHRYVIGTYSKVLVSRGFTGHGLAPPQGLFFTDAQLQSFKQVERAEMSHLVQGMNDDTTDKEEMNELARDLRVTFIEPSKEPPRNTKAPHKDSTEKPRKALVADSLGTKKQKATIPELWFGMIQTKRGDKWLTSNPAEADRAAAKKGSRIDQVFHNQGEAEAWLDSREEDSEDETEIPNLIPCRGYESDDSSVPPSDCNKSGRRKLARRQAKKQAQKACKRQSAREAVKSSGHNSEKKKSHKSSSSSSKGGRKKPKNPVRHRKSKPVTRAMTHRTLLHLPQVNQTVSQKMAPRTLPKRGGVRGIIQR